MIKLILYLWKTLKFIEKRYREEKKITSNHKYNKLLDLSLPINFSENVNSYEKDKDLAMLDFER